MLIDDESHVSQSILDLLALIERDSAIDAIRILSLQELFLEHTALVIRAIENGNVAISEIVFLAEFIDASSHHRGFFLVAIGLEHGYLFAYLLLTEDILLNLPAIVLDDTISCSNDGLRGTIVLFKLEESCITIHLLESENVIDACSSETVDALCVIAYHTNALPMLGKQPHDAMLGEVGILILIDKHKLEPVLIALANIWMFA